MVGVMVSARQMLAIGKLCSKSWLVANARPLEVIFILIIILFQGSILVCLLSSSSLSAPDLLWKSISVLLISVSIVTAEASAVSITNSRTIHKIQSEVELFGRKDFRLVDSLQKDYIIAAIHPPPFQNLHNNIYPS